MNTPTILQFRSALRGSAAVAVALVLLGSGWTLFGATGRHDKNLSDNPVLKEQLAAAKNWYDATKSAYESGTTVLSEVYFSSIAWKDAALAMATDKQERVAAIKAHQQRIKSFADSVEALFQANARGGEMDKRNATLYWLAQAKAWIAAEEAKP